MAQVLYRQYRPQRFGDLVGQEAVRRTLQNEVAAGSIAHAYLFTGPRGVGKTSVARILAKAVNCIKPHDGEPCDKCGNCIAIREGRFLDLIEIDAASNTGVDNIREIIDHVRFSPSSGKYKVIVIDEVHMLSRGAFNALLKTLEEPPAHAVFVLATTEIHKVPATIISRTQRFDFKRLTHADMVEQLAKIAHEEKIKAPDEVLRLVASSSEGSMRDALSLFDQLTSFTEGKITLEEAQEILGRMPLSASMEFFDALSSHNLPDAIEFIDSLVANGRDIVQFCVSYLEYLQIVLGFSVRGEASEDAGLTREDIERVKVQSQSMDRTSLIRMVELFLDAASKVKYSPVAELPLQLAAAKFVDHIPSSPASAPPSSDGRHIASAPSQQVPKPSKENTQPEQTRAEAVNMPIPEAAALDAIGRKWSQFLTQLREYNHSLISSLKLATLVSCDGNRLVIALPYRFHKEAVDQRKNKVVIEKALEDIYGTKLRMEVVLTSDAPGVLAANVSSRPPETVEDATAAGGLVDEAIKVFGLSSQ